MLKRFAVVIPSFNNERWCEQNLESVLGQDYPEFRVLYIDDASGDDTARLVTEYIARHPRGNLVSFRSNEDRLGAAENIDRAVRSCEADEIVLLVDGDDFLAHPQVLARLNELYRDPDLWVTWGQFTRFPEESEGFCAPIPSEIVSANAYRDYPFVASHLRTFYAGLYHRIRPIDIQNADGRFFPIACDVAHMWSLMEMAGPHARFVAEILYRYNRANPINDDKVDREGQLRTELEIRGKARYGRVFRLSDGPPREVYFGTGIGRSLFEHTGKFADADERRKPFRQLRSVLNRLGYTVRESQTLEDVEDPHKVLVFDVRPREIERLADLPAETLALVLWQDPVNAPASYDRRHHERFGRIYTWGDALVDGERYFKFRFPVLRPMRSDIVPFAHRKLCTLIASNRDSDHPDALYGAERALAEYYGENEPDSFDLFGWGWNPEVHRGYRSIIAGRAEYLRRYRFSFCYETAANWPGFVSGKIFESFAAGSVPVYRGAPNIADEIPADCFIARDDFRSEAELHTFLRDMSEREHDAYLERIRAFLSSPKAVPYSPEYFVQTFVALVGGRAGNLAAGRSSAATAAMGASS